MAHVYVVVECAMREIKEPLCAMDDYSAAKQRSRNCCSAGHCDAGAKSHQGHPQKWMRPVILWAGTSCERVDPVCVVLHGTDQLLEILLLLARIRGKIFMWSELRGVHEDGGYDDLALFLARPRKILPGKKSKIENVCLSLAWNAKCRRRKNASQCARQNVDEGCSSCFRTAKNWHGQGGLSLTKWPS